MPRFLFAALLGSLGYAAITATTPARAQPAYQLVWSDEFDGTTLDLGRWEPQIGDGCPSLCGWGNNELEYYRAENATVAGGFLTITAKQESFGGRNYTSARLRTRNLGDWTYGRFEMRAKMPIGQGLWPAFWMLPTDEVYGTWAGSGEIDIMEYLGHQPNRTLGTLHYGGAWPQNQFTSNSFTLPSGDFHNTFHVFALEWEPCEMRWYVDGTLYATQTNWFTTGGPFPAPFDARFHLLLNVAVGGNLPGPPNGSTVFPQEMVVDYVRVYQRPDLGVCRMRFDDMDHGNPLGNGWFEFGGSVGGGGIGADFTDLPADGCRASLGAGFGSGGTPGFVGGFGRRNPLDLTGGGMTHFNLWINPDPGQQYTLEINLQDDDDGDDSIPSTPDGADDEFQFVCQVGPAGPHAVSGGGWQKLSIPLSAFTDDNSFHFGGNGVFDPSPVSAGGNGQLVNVVIAILSDNGSSVTFRTDNWTFTRQTSGVSGRVWDDANGDGVADAGEPGLNGIGVDLFDTDAGAVVASTVTAGDGNYAFSDLIGGSFEVRVDPATLAAGSVPTFDPDGTGTADRFALALGCDVTSANQDFGYTNPTDAPSPLVRRVFLRPNVPNPFNPATEIAFELPEPAAVELSVYDVAGRHVVTLLREPRDAGVHRVTWRGRDARGRQVSGGVYYAVLRTAAGRWTRPMTLVK